MDEIRSCKRCKYSPNMVACHMGRTGNLTFRESLPESFEINPFRPDPARDSTRAFLLNQNRMPCFEPHRRSEMGLFKKARTVLGRTIQIIGYILWVVAGLALLIWTLFVLFSTFGVWTIFVGLILAPVTWLASVFIIWFSTGVFPVILLIPYVVSFIGVALVGIGGKIGRED